ncbi:hypothetical protein [Inquilinus sp. CAU 1745]|uniref:hypothetical protein n=1 Tax=Inquilinus sp. CAU 1745 TaxID=3140369 RepID=UPI00325B27E7
MTDPPQVVDEGVVMKPSVDAEFRLRQERQQMGRVGELFGDKYHAPIWIAGIVCFAVLILIGVAMTFSGNEGIKFFEGLVGVLLGALGYLFGSMTGGSR